MDLVVATRNAGKVGEIRRLLEGTGIFALDLSAFPDAPEVVEDGNTFEANARKKAETVARHTGLLTLADDSGLMVADLDGRPGVHSARFAGPNADDAANNRKLIDLLGALAGTHHSGSFHCAMALCTPGGECRIFAGRLDGLMVTEPRGTYGFGYDPLFLVPEYGRTLAELPLDIKNRISHRGQALRKVLDHLKGLV